jgi:hypothetical protein
LPFQPLGARERHRGTERKVQCLFGWINMNSGFSEKTVKGSALVACTCVWNYYAIILVNIAIFVNHMQVGPE